MRIKCRLILLTIVLSIGISLADVDANIAVDGFASQNGGTTGGYGGKQVTVSNYADFKKYVQSNEKLVVVVSGTIKTTDGDGYGLAVASDKTIIGANSKATIYGGLSLNGVKNVIIYNLNMQGTYPNPGPSDAIALRNTNNVFISHCNIYDSEDGNCDITVQSNYVTVSYVHFYYTNSNNPHRFNSLVGSGAANHPEDYGKLKVTFHHCWFGDLLYERMPRVVYGNVHIYNNYYTAKDNLYCIGVGSYASTLIENNYFKDGKSPHTLMYNIYCNIVAKGNKYVNTSGNKDTGALGERFITTDPYTLKETPITMNSVPYKYTLDKVDDVPSIVQKQAGPH